MPTQTFALSPGAAERLSLSWGAFFDDFQIALDGRPIGRFESRHHLERGDAFALPDGRSLHVRLQRGAMGPSLEVSVDGVPLPGSASDPLSRVRLAGYVLWTLATFSVGLGAVAVVAQPTALVAAGAGWGSIALGLVWGALAVLTARRRRAALLAATVLLSLETVASIAWPPPGGPPGPGTLLLKGLFVAALARGALALGAQKGPPPP